MMAHDRAILACAIVAAMVIACDESRADTIGLHIGTLHMPNDGYCNANPGLYYRTEAGWQVGAYHNSLCKASFYAGKAWETKGNGIRLGAFLGAASGYTSPIMPMAAVSVSMPFPGALRTRLSLAPLVADKSGALLHLSLERDF